MTVLLLPAWRGKVGMGASAIVTHLAKTGNLSGRFFV